MDSYRATYTDAFGTEQLNIRNDGRMLRAIIRGVEFTGTDFDSLEPAAATPDDQLTKFSLCHSFLCSCRIECVIPVSLHDRGCLSQGSLLVELVLGDPGPKGGLDREEVRIALVCEQGRFVSTGTTGWFEDELLEIQAQLPDGVYIRACINCLYSDYSPSGHGLFGGMLCFRNLKWDYLNVRSKTDFWAIHDKYDRLVQETYLCPEFERRVPGTGYRG